MSATNFPLGQRLPVSGEDLSGDAIFSRFIDYVAVKGLSLYPAQEDALLEILAGHNVILATPTGSGKSLVATAFIFKALSEGRRAVYTCPIKALVSEKFFALCQDFGPERVGMLTGDAAINRDAPILCCTAEILASMCMREGHWAPADFVVMDEFHYYADRERGAAWQVPLLVLSSATFLLMSATLGDVTFFEQSITKLTDRKTVTVRSSKRPVPLVYEYREKPLHETVAEYIEKGRAPIYLVNFTQRACAEEAQNLLSVDFCSKEEKRAIADALVGVHFDSPYGKDLSRFIRHGVGLHHAGLLPRYRLLVEKLAQQGLLKVICGTDTLGVGVNVPIRTVLFTQLCKYDGEKTGILAVRDFQQIAGRAGRKGFDDVGYVAAQAPAHVIENMRLESKAAGDPAKLRKIVRRKPPEKGYVHFDRATFERLIASQPEALVSRFTVTHGMVLAVLQRTDRLHDGARALRRLVLRSHGTAVDQRRRLRDAWQIFLSLVEAGVITKETGDDGRWRYRIDRALQLDFNIHNTLSLWLLDTLPKLDKESDSYALDLLTMVESVLENPDVILMRQLDRIKREAIAEMKAAGMEYDQRMEELQKLEYPKPHKDFVYATFNDFVRVHPWVGADNIRPKSIAREAFENYASFSDYIKEYELQRSEGVLLRYLSDMYKTLVQTVPAAHRNAEVLEIIAYFRTMLKEVDSSLLDEWEKLHAAEEGDDDLPTLTAAQVAEAEAAEARAARDVTRNPRAFTAMLRRALYSLVRALANGNWTVAAHMLDPDEEGARWSAEALAEAMRGYFDAHARLRVDHAARSPQNTIVRVVRDDLWEVDQVLVDDDDDNDWMLRCAVDLARSREAARPVLVLREVTT
jgi:superfamily II RNA helicase